MEIILFFAVTLVVLDILALKWSTNTRDGIKESPIAID
jgi:hypothetical protein